MSVTRLASVAVAALALTAVTVQPAAAHDRGIGYGVAALVGAVVGTAAVIATAPLAVIAPRPVYAPPPVAYAPPPVYYAPAPVYYPAPYAVGYYGRGYYGYGRHY